MSARPSLWSAVCLTKLQAAPDLGSRASSRVEIHRPLEAFTAPVLARVVEGRGKDLCLRVSLDTGGENPQPHAVDGPRRDCAGVQDMVTGYQRDSGPAPNLTTRIPP